MTAELLGRYAKYKEATSKVIQWLQATVPQFSSAMASTSTKAMLKAAETVRMKSINVPRVILEYLETSIRLREETANKRWNEKTDAGHAYFLHVLKNIRDYIKPLVEVNDSKTKSAAAATSASAAIDEEKDCIALRNRFEFLQVNSVQEAASKEAVPSSNEVPAVPHVIEEPLRFEVELDMEWFHVICFFADMDDLITNVVDAWKEYKAGKISLIAATAVTNAAVRMISTLSYTLQLTYPYLDNLDKLRAVVLFGDLIDFIQSEHPKVKYADAIEIVSILPILLVDRVRHKTLKKIAQLMRTKIEEAKDTAYRCLQTYMKTDVDMFPPNSAYLSGNNSVSQTQCLLVKMEELCDSKDIFFVAKEGYFGERWDEKTNLAKCTNKLSDFLCADVIPGLLHAARYDRFVEKQDAAMPLIPITQDFIRKKSVSVPFVFAIHCTLLAVVSTEGENFCTRLGVLSTVSMEKLANNIKKNLESRLFDTFFTEKNLKRMLEWLDFVNQRRDHYMDVQRRRRGMFNPWMAGQHLAVASLVLAFDCGLQMLDSVGQARLVLHLYNALRVIRIMKAVPFLDMLIDLLSRTKSLWVAGRPTKQGSFLRGALLAWGHTIDSSQMLVAAVQDREVPRLIQRLSHVNRRMKLARGLQLPVTSDILQSFRFMANQDYSGLSSESYETMLEDVKHLVEQDRKIIGLDLMSVGRAFLIIWKKLLEEFKLHVSVEKMMHEPEGSLPLGNIKRKKGWKESKENELIFFEMYHLQMLVGLCDSTDRSAQEELQLQACARIIADEVANPEAFWFISL